jgi:hypothetical protein
MLVKAFTPLVPSDKALYMSGLLDKAKPFISRDAKLARLIRPEANQTIEHDIEISNAHYSNLIKGHKVSLE